MSDIIRINAIETDRYGARHVEFEINGEESSGVFHTEDRLLEVEGASPLHTHADALRFILAWWRARDPSGDPATIVGKRLRVDFADLVTPVIQLDL